MLKVDVSDSYIFPSPEDVEVWLENNIGQLLVTVWFYKTTNSQMILHIYRIFIMLVWKLFIGIYNK